MILTNPQANTIEFDNDGCMESEIPFQIPQIWNVIIKIRPFKM